MLSEANSSRVSLLIASSFAAYAVHEAWPKLSSTAPGLASLMLVSTLGGVGLACTLLVGRWRSLGFLSAPTVLASALLLVAADLAGSISAGRVVYSTDGMAFVHGAALEALSGRNPYAVSLEGYLWAFGLSLRHVTPTMDGGFVRELTYPSLSFLAFTPFLSAGVVDLRLAVLAFYAASLVAAYLLAPRRGRLLSFTASAAVLTLLSVNGVFDVVWVLLLILSLNARARGHRWLGWALLGLSASYKQLAWAAVPLVALREARSNGLRSSLLAAATCLAAFLALNLPFMLSDTLAWARGVLRPAWPSLAPMVPAGGGLVSLLYLGVPLPIAFLNGAAAATYTALLALHAVSARPRWRLAWLTLPFAFILLPRSYPIYWLCWVPVAALDPGLDAAQPMRAKPLAAGRARWIAGLYALSLAILLASAAAWMMRQPLKIGAVEALDLDGDGSFEALRVEVSNRGEASIKPLLAVTLSHNAYYWRLVDGPRELRGGSTATYLFMAPDPSVRLPMGSCFTVFLNDEVSPQVFTASGLHRAA
jgi:hypothetical protein